MKHVYENIEIPVTGNQFHDIADLITEQLLGDEGDSDVNAVLFSFVVGCSDEFHTETGTPEFHVEILIAVPAPLVVLNAINGYRCNTFPVANGIL